MCVDNLEVNENYQNSDSESLKCSKCPKKFKGLLYLTDHFNKKHRLSEDDKQKANLI